MDSPNTALAGLTPEDRVAFHRFGFGPATTLPFETIQRAFRQHAALHPLNLAVVDFDISLSYSELDRRSDILAYQLRSNGVKNGSRVCVLVERSTEMVVSILATLKAGGAYVPLDGHVVSQSTLQHVLSDAQPVAILTLRRFAERVTSRPVICIEEMDWSIPLVPVDDTSNSSQSAYIIYTSGTTGVPKGVDVSHRNVINLVCQAPGNLGMSPGVKVAQLMNISFDMAAWEILGSLCNGATLYLRGKSKAQWIATMKAVDVVIGTPSVLELHNPTDYNIKTVAVAGEPCSQHLADLWSRETRFYNSCGPTETTIVNTMHVQVSGEPTCIGKPTPNNNVYILDEDLQPLPIGTVGVMWAGGAGISRGYLNLPQKTSERYKPDPFVFDGSMMFNTGDLGRWREDGSLEHFGRIDDQVKVKGFRVELDGVASSMETYPGVRVAVVLLVEGELWGFAAPTVEDVSDLKTVVSQLQPYYAVPTRIITFDELPKTMNGKTDKKALRQLALDTLSQASIDHQGIKENPPVKIESTSSDSISLQVSQPASKTSVSSLQTTMSSTIPPNSTDVSLSEKAEPWEGYMEEVLPRKGVASNVRHQILTLYRRIFGVVFVTNVSILIAILVRGTDAQQLGLIVISNLMVAILMRQDYIINIFFNVFCAVPSSWPMTIRRICARVYHIGGIHSGCASSGVVWLIALTGQLTYDLVRGGKASIATVAVTYTILVFLIGIVIFAYPAFRSKKHNTFEHVHRFLGWTATALVWVQVILLTRDYRPEGLSLGAALLHAVPFWFIVIITISIILPWSRLRKVPVRCEVLSPHAVRMFFDYSTPITGSFVRLSEDPLREWHGFATIPVPNEKGFSLIVSNGGDWTKKQIMNPPTEIWVRGAPAFGVLRIVPLFRRVVLVATGSGIGPCAPCILEGRIPIRLLWTSPDVRQTFGDTFVDSILKAEPNAVIYNTRKHGKPDMVKLTYRLVRDFNAEAVCVISNQKLTMKIVYGMMSRGIPAFGAIWDS